MMCECTLLKICEICQDMDEEDSLNAIEGDE